jgi:LPXTG-motif cell wall-anchored protein
MREAAIAPETITPPAEFEPEAASMDLVTSAQRHERSLKVDARRVNVNQGAMVTVEGQLNPPAASSLPQLEWAPPAEEGPDRPPFELAMIEPAHESAGTPPPLPPPNSKAQTEPEPLKFLYAENPGPPPEPVKNVQWEEAEAKGPADSTTWWTFPAMGVVGLLLIGLLFLKRKRA